MASIRVRAHAKINLSLRVLGRRRDDGYHELRTVFQALALHDTVTLVPRAGAFSIESEDARPALPLDKGNLVWRAADLLWAYLRRPGVPADVLVRLGKHIPMKGGLGGGSSDAASTLVGLARLWDAAIPADALRRLGRELGADVAFFFTGGAAFGFGRGDQLQPLPDLPRLAVVLVIPGFDVSTAEAYRWIDEARGDHGRMGEGDCDEPVRYVPASATQCVPGCAWAPPACDVVNDFESVVATRHPEVETIKAALRAAGAASAAMTGSGSTVFGLFEAEDAAARAAARVAQFGEVMITHTLGRAEYLEASTPVEET